MFSLYSIFAFPFVLGIIVFVHEGGHFLVAKLFRVRVLVFSLGFGKRLAGFDYKGTDVRLSAIPLGGYVQMWGELPEDRTGLPDEFPAKPRWQRILIYLAGPAANVVLSVAVIAAVFMAGYGEQAYQEMPAVVGGVVEGSAAEAAGLRPEDRIIEVDGKAVDRWEDVSFMLQLAPEKTVPLVALRGEERLELAITPKRMETFEIGDHGIVPPFAAKVAEILEDTPADRAGFRPGDTLRQVDGLPIRNPDDFIAYVKDRAEIEIVVTVERGDTLIDLPVVPARIDDIGRIGISIGAFRKLPLFEAIGASARYNVDIVRKSMTVLGKLLTNEVKPKSALSGPIEMMRWSGHAAKRGWRDLIFLTGFLSISIGFMNLLPIPVLDGGNIAILLFESVIRRDLSTVIKERVTQFGFMLLLMLMVMVLYFDLAKNLPALPN